MIILISCFLYITISQLLVTIYSSLVNYLLIKQQSTDASYNVIKNLWAIAHLSTSSFQLSFIFIYVSIKLKSKSLSDTWWCTYVYSFCIWLTRIQLFSIFEILSSFRKNENRAKLAQNMVSEKHLVWAFFDYENCEMFHFKLICKL